MQYSTLPEGVVCVVMTHSNLPSEHPDIRLELHMTILEVKEKFRFHIGTPIDYQRLILKDHGHVIGELSDNSKKLGFYSVVSGMEIHIIDTDPFSLSRNGGLTDTSLVQKYTMSEEAYSNRKGTMREYIREKKKLNPKFSLNTKNSADILASEKEKEPLPDANTVASICIGDRCEVQPGARRGIVKFVGEIESTGYWVGVHFDEPVGKGDGSAKGVVYFECPMKYGGFVRGKNVTTGDFPERDILDEDDEENENGIESQKEDENEM